MVDGPTPPPIEPPGSTPPPPAFTPPPAKPVLPWVILGLGIVAVVAAVVVVFITRSSEPSASDTTSTTSVTTTTVATTATTAGGTTTTSGSVASTTTTTVPAGPAADIDASGTWTVLMYGLGDNDLEWFFLNDMREMRSATANTPGLTFLVLADRADGQADDALGSLGEWTTAKLVQIADGSFTELDDWGEVNMGEAGTLIDFIETATAAAPADHHAIVFWDHGSMMGVGPDFSHSDVLESWEIAAGLEAGLGSTGVTIDIVGFDACMMGSLEVASVVAPYATFMIASEELEPGEGWQYAGFEYLADPDPTVIGLGEAILGAYHDTSAPGYSAVTLSMLDLRAYDEFAAALEGFTLSALDTIDASAAEIGRRRDRSVKFGSDPDPLQDWFMVDLGQVLSKLSRSDAPIADEAAEAARLLNEMVVGNVTGEATSGARGLAVHFPSAPAYHYPQWYEVYGEPGWSSFLNGYFAAGEALPESRRAAVVRTSPITSYLFDDYGLEITAEIQEGALDTVVSANLWSGIPTEDGAVVFYSSDQGIVEGNTAIGFYDLTQLVLNDGVDEAIAFQQITISEDLTIVTITVPLQYRAPIDSSNGVFDEPIDVTLKVGYNLETDEFTEELFYANLGTIGAFTPAPDGLFFPKLPVRLPDGEIEWVVTTDVGLWSDMPYLLYDFVDLPSGTPLYAELTIADFGGNTAVVDVTTEVP